MFVMLLTETIVLENILKCWVGITYAAVFSGAIAYTLQILAQKDSNPTVVSLLMSLESVFATLAGVIVLHDKMSSRELIGCVLMFAAVMLAQLPDKESAK